MATTISASPQTLADSAPQLTRHDHLYNHYGLCSRVSLPDPTHLQSSLAKRRSNADRRLLFELGRSKSILTRRSSHKAMGKRMFFILSGRHHIQKLVSPSYERISQLDKKPSVVLQYRLPSFRDGFSDWALDSNHMKPIQSEIPVDTVSDWQEDAGSQLPSIPTLLKRAW